MSTAWFSELTPVGQVAFLRLINCAVMTAREICQEPLFLEWANAWLAGERDALKTSRANMNLKIEFGVDEKRIRAATFAVTAAKEFIHDDDIVLAVTNAIRSLTYAHDYLYDLGKKQDANVV